MSRSMLALRSRNRSETIYFFLDGHKLLVNFYERLLGPTMYNACSWYFVSYSRSRSTSYSVTYPPSSARSVAFSDAKWSCRLLLHKIVLGLPLLQNRKCLQDAPVPDHVIYITVYIFNRMASSPHAHDIYTYSPFYIRTNSCKFSLILRFYWLKIQALFIGISLQVLRATAFRRTFCLNQQY